MATRDHRLKEFDQGPPPEGQPLEVLCEDHSGTYVPPFACRWTDGAWRNCQTDDVIAARVVGWRGRR